MQRELELLVYASVTAAVAGAFYFTAFHSPVVVVTTSSPVVTGTPSATPLLTIAEDLPAPPPTRARERIDDERRAPVTLHAALSSLDDLQEQRRLRTNDHEFSPRRVTTVEHLFADLEHPVVSREELGRPSLQEIREARAQRTNDDEFEARPPLTFNEAVKGHLAEAQRRTCRCLDPGNR